MPSAYPQPPKDTSEEYVRNTRALAAIAQEVVVDPERGRFSHEWRHGTRTLVVDPDTKALLDRD